jgi:hypothetical protein
VTRLKSSSKNPEPFTCHTAELENRFQLGGSSDSEQTSDQKTAFDQYKQYIPNERGNKNILSKVASKK